MKLPGMGDVKNKYLLYGGGGVALVVAISYYRKKKTSSAAAANAAVDPNAIDPSTGLTYGSENGYGSNNPSSTPSYAGNNSSQTPVTNATTGVADTTNALWMADALQTAQNFNGATYQLATDSLNAYVRQDIHGLQADQYNLVSEVVALIGQPPTGGPYRLIQGTPIQTPSPTPVPVSTPVPVPVAAPTPAPVTDGIPPGYHMQDPQVGTLTHGTSLRTFARWNYPVNTQTHLDRLIQLNPGLGVDDTSHGTMLIRVSDAHLVPNN